MTIMQNDIQRHDGASPDIRNTLNLQTVRELFQSRANDAEYLKLDEDGRELLFTGELKTSLSSISEATVLLFDHAIVFAHISGNQKDKSIEIYRRPIPLELLSLSQTKGEDSRISRLRPSFLIRRLKDSSTNASKKETWPITFRHCGKSGYELTLYASCQADQEKWIELIGTARDHLQGHSEVFNPTIICSNFFSGSNKINCAVSFDHGQKVLYGTDNGMYLSDREKHGMVPEKVLDTRKVTQIDISEEYRLLLVLSNKILQSYSLMNLDSPAFPILQNPKTLQTHCSLFRTGVCMEKSMVSCVKSGSLSTTIKVFVMSYYAANGDSTERGCTEFELFKEFYIPRETFSVHFLASKICLAGPQGFEVVSLETLETQMLLDVGDTTLDFAHKKGSKPIHMQRIGEEFLLNYTEFSFFVTRNGMRAQPQFRLNWEGSPQSFTVSYPWIFAFEPKFIELRNIKTGAVHIVLHKNIRMLHSSSQEVLFTYEDEIGQDVVEIIGF